MMKEATRLIRGESGSSLLLYLQEMDVNRVRDDVKMEALPSAWYISVCTKWRNTIYCDVYTSTFVEVELS